MEDRLIELEMKVAFQDDAMRKLGEVVAELEKEVYRVSKALEAARAKLAALEPAHLVDPGAEPPPPHY